MKPHLWLAALACAVLSASAHAQQVGPDTAALPHVGSGPGFEFRVGGDYLSGQRNVWINNSLQQATGTIEGADGFLWIPDSPLGLSARYLQADFGAQQPALVAADANILIGAPAFSLQGGYARRALSTSVSTALYSFWRAGVQTLFRIGGSGLRGRLSGTYYLPSVKKSTNGAQTTGDIHNGMDGEASLLFNPPHLPFVYLEAGYRAELFTAKRTTGTIPEEVHGLMLGGGLQIGGH